MTDKDLLLMIDKYVEMGNHIHKRSSYGLKECFEELSGDYVPHEQFKRCMSKAGFQPTKSSMNNNHHYYQIRIIGNAIIPNRFLDDGRFWLNKTNIKHHGKINRF